MRRGRRDPHAHEGNGGRHADDLSAREREVLSLMGDGLRNREIAERLVISPWTVKEYTGTVYKKLGVRNRTEAVQRAQRLGLLS